MVGFMNRIQEKISDVEYILIASIISFVLQIPLQILANLYERYFGSINTYSLGKSEVFIWISSILIGPIIESVLLVFLIKVLKNKFHILKKVKLFIIATVIFTILHYYSFIYIMLVFPNCLIIIYSYMYYKPKKLSSFKIMLFVHMVINTYMMVLSKL